MSWERSCVTAQAIARVVSLARGAASSWTSLNVTTSQASSRHLKIRLRHTTRTGTPAQGRSWSTTSRRPWPVASTPQDGQPTSDGTVSTTTVNERGPRSTALTWTSGRSKSAHAGAQIA